MARPEIVGHVETCLLRMLAGGAWPAGAELAPSRRLAGELGVSRPVVLAALGRLAQAGLLAVRPRRPVRVLAGAAEQAGEMLAERARSARITRVALLYPEHYLPVQNPFFVELIERLGAEAARHAMRTELVPWPLERQLRAARSLIARGFGAAVCLSFHRAYTAGLQMLREQRFPVILFNRHARGVEVPCVRTDDYEAVQGIGQRLLELGHTNLCMVTHFLTDGSASGHNVVAGWVGLLRERGVLHQCSMPVYALPWIEGLGENPNLLANLLEHPRRPTALVFTAGLWAERFLGDARFAALRVPEDVSVVVSYPGRELSDCLEGRPVTSIDINHQRAAECTVELLRRTIAEEGQLAAFRIPLDVRITGSIGPPPGEPNEDAP